MKKIIIFITLALFIFSGCASKNTQTSKEDTGLSKTEKGAIIGGLLGAIVGASTKGSNKGKRVIVGGILGAAVGGAVGYGLEEKAKEVAKELDTKVNNDPKALLDPREGIVVSHTKDYIKITFKSDMMFKTNSSIPTLEASQKIDKVTKILKKYPDMLVQVVGHTDSRGLYEYNQVLSEKRAKTVGDRIYNSGVANSIFSKGCSFNRPLVPNNSVKNQDINRRVEIYLYENEAAVINPCAQN